MAEQAGKTFISYAREDKEFALKLAGDLRGAGEDVWVDQLDIPPGAQWPKRIEEAVESCPRMLVILSPASVASKNVTNEVLYALDEGKEVIPVLHRKCKVPLNLLSIQHVDFTKDFDGGLKLLLGALGLVKKKETPGTSRPETSPASNWAIGVPEPRPERKYDPADGLKGLLGAHPLRKHVTPETSRTALPPEQALPLGATSHLELLQKAIEAGNMKIWNQWRKDNPKIIPDLLGANLSRAKLIGVDLSGVYLLAANLSRANLSEADLSEAIELSQQQIDAADGDSKTKLPRHIKRPSHWKK